MKHFIAALSLALAGLFFAPKANAQRYYAPTQYTAPNQVWVPGHYQVTPNGRRVWVPGHYQTQTQVHVQAPPRACATPVAPAAYHSSISPQRMDFLVAELRSQPFESQRLLVADRIIQNNWLTVNQVRRIMRQMNFESSRLKVAKRAYAKTVNPGNYHLVNNEFSFSSSVRELNRYIHTRF